MRIVYEGALVLVLALFGAAAGGCAGSGTDDGSGATQQDRQELTSATTCQVQTVPWGADQGEVGLLPAVAEQTARGPMAIGVRGGVVVVLDNQNRRVLSVARDGSTELVAPADVTAEDVAVGSDGSLGVWSPLTGRVEVYGPGGDHLGAVSVPRALRSATWIELGASHRVQAVSALQERHQLGSPSAPLALDAVLRSKLEGAYRIGEDQAVTVVARDGRAEVRVAHAPLGGRARLLRAMAVPGAVSAAQIVGGDGAIVCLRTERIDPGSSPVSVQRRLACVDTGSGRWLLDRDLAGPGPYLPRRELSVRRVGQRLVTVHAVPTDAGLELSRCEVPL